MRKNFFFWILVLFEAIALYAFVSGKISVVTFLLLTAVVILNETILVMYYQKKNK